MPSECCVEYKLIRLYQKSSVWCFAFSHASTFELIPQLPRLCRELGNTSSYVPNLNFLPQFVSERAGGSKSGGAGPGGWRSRQVVEKGTIEFLGQGFTLVFYSKFLVTMAPTSRLATIHECANQLIINQRRHVTVYRIMRLSVCEARKIAIGFLRRQHDSMVQRKRIYDIQHETEFHEIQRIPTTCSKILADFQMFKTPKRLKKSHSTKRAETDAFPRPSVTLFFDLLVSKVDRFMALLVDHASKSVHSLSK